MVVYILLTITHPLSMVVERNDHKPHGSASMGPGQKLLQATIRTGLLLVETGEKPLLAPRAPALLRACPPTSASQTPGGGGAEFDSQSQMVQLN